MRPRLQAEERFRRWATGTAGDPTVDAELRKLDEAYVHNNRPSGTCTCGRGDEAVAEMGT